MERKSQGASPIWGTQVQLFWTVGGACVAAWRRLLLDDAPWELGDTPEPWIPNPKNPPWAVKTTNILDLLGGQGWELVAVQNELTALSPGSWVGEWQTTLSRPVRQTYQFKRPIAE